MRVKFSVTPRRFLGLLFVAVCLLQHYRLLDHRTVYRREWIQLSRGIHVYSAYSGPESTIILAAIDPPGQFDNIICFYETPLIRHITFTTMRTMKDTDTSNLAIFNCPLAIPPGEHIGLRVVGSEVWSRLYVGAVRSREAAVSGLSPTVCYLKKSWFTHTQDDFTFDASKALKWTNPLLGAGVDCFFRMQIQTEWIVSADRKTNVFGDKAELLAKLSKDRVYLLSCAGLSAVLFHRNMVLSENKTIVRDLLPLNNTRLC